MPKPLVARNAAVAALLLGAAFLIANLHLSGAGYPTLAKVCFVLVILCVVAFAVGAVLWVFVTQWERESQPQAPPPAMPGPMPKMKVGNKPPPPG